MKKNSGAIIVLGILAFSFILMTPVTVKEKIII